MKRKRQSKQGAQDSRNYMVMNTLCVCFLLHVFQTGNEEKPASLEGRDSLPKKRPQEKPPLSIQWGAQQETFQIITTSATPTKILHTIPNPNSKDQVGSLGVHPHQTTKRRPKPLIGGGQGKLTGEPQAKETFSSSHNDGEDHGRTMKEPQKN